MGVSIVEGNKIERIATALENLASVNDSSIKEDAQNLIVADRNKLTDVQWGSGRIDNNETIYYYSSIVDVDPERSHAIWAPINDAENVTIMVAFYDDTSTIRFTNTYNFNENQAIVIIPPNANYTRAQIGILPPTVTNTEWVNSIFLGDVTSISGISDAEIAYLRKKIDAVSSEDVADVIRSSTQTLSSAEQLQARTNIGAVGTSDVAILLNNAVLLSEQTLTNEQKAQVLENIGAAAVDDLDYVIRYSQQSLSSAEQLQARTNIGAVSSDEVTGVVKYTEQTLTDEQQEQARENIGAASVEDVEGLIPNSVSYDAQTLTEAQKTQARTNIGAASVGSINDILLELQQVEEQVSDVTKVDGGIQIEYGNGDSKTIEIDAGGAALDSVVYDSEYYLHFYDANGEELYDGPIFIQGGGGGGTGGGGTAAITRITPATVDCIYGESMNVEFSFTATDSAGDEAGQAIGYWTIGGLVAVQNISIAQGNNSFDIGPYLNSGTNAVQLVVSVDVGGESNLIVRKTWSINAVDMSFTWPYADAQINETSFQDSWVVYGDILKTTHTLVDGTTELDTVSTSRSNSTQTLLIPMMEHGAHGVERWLSATIGSSTKQTQRQYHEMIFVEAGDTTPIIAVSMKDIKMQQYGTVQIPVVVYDPSAIQTNASLAVDGNVVGTWTQMDRTVHYWTFTASDIGSGTPTKYKEVESDIGETIQVVTEWTHSLTITCGSTVKTLIVTVSAIDLNVEEVPGYSFRFKASEFAANEAVRNWESNGVTATFSSNFDWVNGGLKTETVDDMLNETTSSGTLQQYFCIKAGSRMTINHQLFATEPKNNGMTFKIVFKIKNCRDYNAEIGNCYAGTGIRMYAHKAYLNSTGTEINTQYNENEYIELEFDVYPSTNDSGDTRPRYVMAWLDGVITTARIYGSSDAFVQGAQDRANITLGSDDCDLYIYMVKSYPMLLNNDSNFNNHISNFIMDAPNTAEMIRRYNRNDILDTTGDISYEKVMEHNPDLRVWLYDIPYMTNGKKDKVAGSKFEQFWPNGDTYYHIRGEGELSVQGTSSVGYIRGAANTDINFTKLTDGNGNNLLAGGTKDETYGGSNNWYFEDPENPGHAKVYTTLDAKIDAGVRKSYTVAQARRIAKIDNNPEAELGSEWVVYETDSHDEPISYINSNDLDDGTLGNEWIVVERDILKRPVSYIKALGFKINDDSCPITYSNTKVNFASCEQVNNMCNALWYQRFNPYPSNTARDCMEFNMGIQFIKDAATGDSNHFALFDNTTKYNMYSIANMGNSKKNVHVFHDLSNENEVCIEVKDNTTDQMRMISDDLSTQDWSSSESHFEMRFPDTKNPSQDIRNAWQRLVTWFATNNPNAATNDPLPEAETYSAYTFRGHDRPGTQVLRGTTITQYAGTYTNDTFERRMAKMLNECENYLVMDSFVYHFVYLERHTMVDNVSKNNFWSSTDLVHWDLSKAYDMDTSDGNNNQGKLVFDYGLEYDDVNPEDSKMVFNGGDSVWFVFIANLYEACRVMFQNRESEGAWSASAYHNFLLNEQRKVPERCWNQCYWYDYLRTYEKGIVNETDWLPYLDGGQKTHQRKHFETFQELYMSSKYHGTASTSQNITIFSYAPATWGGVVTNSTGAALRVRASNSASTLMNIPYNAQISISEKVKVSGVDWRKVTYDDVEGYVLLSQISSIEPNGELTITMYNKMYISVDNGTIVLPPVKAERGIPYTIRFNDSGVLSNSIISVNAASMIQGLSGIEQLYPDNCTLSNAIRLREISIGSDQHGYYNTNLRSISFGNNGMLERLYIQNQPNATSVLDLTHCPALVYLDATGSGFTGYEFANGGVLEQAILNAPVTLNMRNLTKLTDAKFSIADYSKLTGLYFENVDGVDSQALVTTAQNLQIARLIGIDWYMVNTDLLDRMLRLQGYNQNGNATGETPAILAGRVHSEKMRILSHARYEEAWSPDLIITYDTEVEQYAIYFYNYDGVTRILDKQGFPYTQYIDRGDDSYDPLDPEYDEIDTPVRASDDQYIYTFAGWDNLPTQVLADANVIAQYSTQAQTYTVRWYSSNDRTAVLLKTATASYGDDLVYEDNDHGIPTRTDEEDRFYYNVFIGWDKSTGFIRKDNGSFDIDVHALWDRKALPIAGSKELKDMSIAEIYGVAKSGRALRDEDAGTGYWTPQDYVDIRVGHDFNFENVESEVILQNRYFNGNEIYQTNIKLFDENAPSFTLAIDYEFASTAGDATLASCFETSGSEGFRVYYYVENATSNHGVRLLWGDRAQTLAHGMNRGVIVLRHRKGSKSLYVASDNGGKYIYHSSSNVISTEATSSYRFDGYNDDIVAMEVTRTQNTSTNNVLVFGGLIDQQAAQKFKGWIHWCKIWYDDLGINNIKKIGCWPHETWRMHYRGSGIYSTIDGAVDGASFVANAPLPQYYDLYGNNPSSYNSEATYGGWPQNSLRTFINRRCFDALPVEWQCLVKTLTVPTKGGSNNPNVLEYTQDKMIIPARADMIETSETLYTSEGTLIPWFVDSLSKVKFIGITIPDNAQYFVDRTQSLYSENNIIIQHETVSGDPTTLTESYTVHEGDVWITSNNTVHVYVTAETAARHGMLGGRLVNDTYNIAATGSQGGLWIRAYSYFTRSPSGSATQYIVSMLGSVTTASMYYGEYRRLGIILGFSI